MFLEREDVARFGSRKRASDTAHKPSAEVVTPVPTSVRSATVADVPALLALVNSAYRGDASRLGWTTEADLLGGQRTDEDELAGAIEAQTGQMLIAESGSDLVGCCHLDHRSPEVAVLGMLAVRPVNQGVGTGSAIIRHAERIARTEWECSQVRMTVIRQRLELIAWYERLGYRRTGELVAIPYGDERFGTPLVDDLVFFVRTKGLS